MMMNQPIWICPQCRSDVKESDSVTCSVCSWQMLEVDGVWSASPEYRPEHFSEARRAHLVEIEADHFWFESRRKLIERKLGALLGGGFSSGGSVGGGIERVVELGCGSGGMLPYLANYAQSVFAVDAHPESARSAKLRESAATVLHGSVTDTPLASEQFDLAISLDVLEHVEPNEFLAEALRLVKPGGKLLVAVPAFSSLWSAADERAGHRLRYEIEGLRTELQRNGWRLVDYTHYQCFLFPLIYASRVFSRNRPPTLERNPPEWINRALSAINAAEVKLFGGGRLPFGSSLIAWAEKPLGSPPPDSPSLDSDHCRYQREYFDASPRWRIKPTQSSYVRRHFDELLSAAAPKTSDRILEVGAGMGRFTLLLEQEGYDVVASDLSEKLLAALRDECPALETVAGDALDLPSRLNGQFDQVLGFFMLHHLPDVDRAFQGLARLVKPGGRIAFVEPNAYYVPFYLQVFFSRRMSWRGDGGIVRMRSGLISRAMRSAGLVPMEVKSYGFFPPGITNHPQGRRFEEKLESLPLPGALKAFRIFQAEKPDDPA